MNALRDALVQYVALRRALGSKFQEPAVTLQHFVDFLERESAEVITTELALRWAMEPKGVQRAPDYPHLLPAVQIRTNLAAEMPSLHGSKRDTAALTAMHQHIAPTPLPCSAKALFGQGKSAPPKFDVF